MEQVESGSDDLLFTEWQTLINQTPVAAHELLLSLSDKELHHLVTIFYDYMLSHTESALFLNTEQVNSRLSSSMFHWLRAVLGSSQQDLHELLAKQHEIGIVHAHIGLPIDLVARAARKIKEELYQILALRKVAAAHIITDAICFSGLAIDTAIEAMTASYSPSVQNSVNAEEQYRLLTIYDDINVERERQIRSLTDWENQFIYNIATGLPIKDLVFLSKSEFGMWFAHKGKHILGKSELLSGMETLMKKIDHHLKQELPLHAQLTTDERLKLLQEIRQLTAQIHILLSSMFEDLVKEENGKDSLTQLLNRRFIPTIMRREISIALHSRKPFALAMLDIDYFKQINDRYGHNTGDNTLKNVSAMIYEHIRSSDYVFRYGGEEFMILLVETELSKAKIILENLRNKMADLRIQASASESFSVTVSIGVAEYDYHPDYKLLIEKADSALYYAKSQGRNRVEVFQPHMTNG